MLVTCRHCYSKDRSKSTDSHHCCYNKTARCTRPLHHSAIFDDVEPKILRHYRYWKVSGSVGSSCMVIQILPHNIVKDGGMFCDGVWKKSICYSSSDGSPCILNGVWVAISTTCWLLWRWKGDGKGYFSVKTCVEVNGIWTEHFERASKSKNQREGKIASKWPVWSSYSLFPFYFTPESVSWGNLWVESSAAVFISIGVQEKTREVSCLTGNRPEVIS